jgi:hypothetical protein
MNDIKQTQRYEFHGTVYDTMGDAMYAARKAMIEDALRRFDTTFLCWRQLLRHPKLTADYAAYDMSKRFILDEITKTIMALPPNDADDFIELIHEAIDARKNANAR